MANLQEVFNRLEKAKKEQKDIKAMYRDALKNSSSYQETLEEIKSFKEKKKKIEDGIKDDFVKEFDKLEIIKNEIETDKMLLSDAALSQYLKGENVEIIDEYNNRYEPIFTVRFKKI